METEIVISAKSIETRIFNPVPLLVSNQGLWNLIQTQFCLAIRIVNQTETVFKFRNRDYQD